MSISCASPSMPRCTVDGADPLHRRGGVARASSAAACSTRSATSSSWSATRPRSRRRSRSASPASTSAIRCTSARSPCPRAPNRAITDRDFTIATIVAPSGVKIGSRGRGAAEGAEAPGAAEVPLVGEDEAEGEPKAARSKLPLLAWLGTLFGAKPVEVPGQPASAPEAEDWGEFAPVQIWVGLGNPGAQYAMQRHNVGFMAVDAIAEVHGFDPPKKAFSGWAQQGRIGGAAHPAAQARHLHERQRPLGPRGDGLLQEGASATSPSSTTSSISPRSRSR